LEALLNPIVCAPFSSPQAGDAQEELLSYLFLTRGVEWK
jgi:hypothetical protein